MDSGWLDWMSVAVLGGVVGASELISRYRDAPDAALKTWPAILYISINSLASVGALALIETNGWLAQGGLTRILLAGVSAMAFFRTSLFVIRAGDRDVGVGPSGFLQIFLSAADRAVDRKRGAARSDAVGKVMNGIDYDKAKQVLALYCLGLMQNVPQEDQQQLVRALEALDKREMDSSVKVKLLGIELINVVGVDVLTTALKALRDQIRADSTVPES